MIWSARSPTNGGGSAQLSTRTGRVSSAGLTLEPHKKPTAPAATERALAALAAATATQPAPPNAPHVVCGMVTVSADPKLDERMIRNPPQTDTRFTIRAVTPAICNPSPRP